MDARLSGRSRCAALSAAGLGLLLGLVGASPLWGQPGDAGPGGASGPGAVGDVEGAGLSVVQPGFQLFTAAHGTRDTALIGPARQLEWSQKELEAGGRAVARWVPVHPLHLPMASGRSDLVSRRAPETGLMEMLVLLPASGLGEADLQAAAELAEQGGMRLLVQFRPEARERLADWAGRNLGRRVATVLDGRAVGSETLDLIPSEAGTLTVARFAQPEASAVVRDRLSELAPGELTLTEGSVAAFGRFAMGLGLMLLVLLSLPVVLVLGALFWAARSGRKERAQEAAGPR